MQFEYSRLIEKFGQKAGFLISYLLFTTILFLILSFTNKIPNNWSYLHIAGLTLGIVLVGKTIKRGLR